MFTKKFWIDALERAIRTFAQFMVAGEVMDPLSQDLQTSLQTKLVAALIGAGTAVLMSLAGSGFGQKDSASFIDAPGDDGAIVAGDAILFVVAFLLGAIVTKVFIC